MTSRRAWALLVLAPALGLAAEIGNTVPAAPGPGSAEPGAKAPLSASGAASDGSKAPADAGHRSGPTAGQRPSPVIGPPDAAGLRWQFHALSGRSGQPRSEGPSGQLVFGIPETDATQIIATCTGAGTVTVDASLPVDGLAAGRAVEVAIRGKTYDTLLPGVVLHGTGEQMSGVRLRPALTDKLWTALMGEQALTYGLGRTVRPLPLQGARAAVGTFLEHCGALAPARTGLGPSATLRGADLCRSIPTFRPVGGRPKIDIQLVNRTGEFRHADQGDRDGVPITLGSLQEGETLAVSIEVGSPIVLRDGPGNCIEVIVPDGATNRIEHSMKSPGFGEE